METFYTMDDVQKMLGCSKPKVIEIFHRPDFPALMIVRPYRVEQEAFREWCRRRRTNQDFKK